MLHFSSQICLRQRWHFLGLFALLIAVAAVNARWVFLVPIFQAPDEDVHLDFALAIHQHRGLFFLPNNSRFELGFVHPYTRYLRERTVTAAVVSHPEVKMPANYGSRTFWMQLDDECPPHDALAVDKPPCLAWVYPFGYYALLAVWIEVLMSIKNSLAFVFFGCRLFSIFLLLVSLLASFGTLREMRFRRGFSLLVTGLIGFFPLTSFVSSYVQPDNLSFTLVALSYLLTLVARRRMDRDWLFGLLGLLLGALLITKVHYFLATLIPAVLMLAVEAGYRKVEPGRRVKLALLLLLPSLATGSIYLQTVGGSINAFGAAAPHGNLLLSVPHAFFKAIKDFYYGTTHKSFWGIFGWLDTPLIIGPAWLNQLIRIFLLLGTWAIVILTLMRIKQTVGVVYRVLRHRSGLAGIRMLVADPVLNSLFLFTAFMIYFHMRTDNRFGAQGRNWFPLLLPIFLTVLHYAPQALSARRRRKLCTKVVAASLMVYCLLGTWSAFPTLQQRYYDPGRNHPSADRVFSYRTLIPRIFRLLRNRCGTISGMNLDHALQMLARNPRAAFDVAELALHLARDEYPELDVEAYLNELNGMAHEVRSHLKGNFAAKVAGLCRYLFHDMGFRGNSQDYYDPRNSYLNQVIDRRTGIPITLSALAMAIGGRVGIDIQGIGLPGHFVVKAVAGRQEILFDPFNAGRILTTENCEQLVHHVTGMSFQATRAQLQALPLGLMLERMAANLKAIYMREGDCLRAIRVIERLRQLDPDNPIHQRDLGVMLLQAGQSGKAIDHLSAYLDRKTSVDDGKNIRELLERARTDVAKWN